jgi:hypothetical protein
MRVKSITKDNKIPIREKDFTRTVSEYASLRGWLVAHFRPAMDRHGRWKTPVQGDGTGFPDLVMARAGKVIFAELKTDNGKMTDNQGVWLYVLPNAYLWRPSDWERIQEILK